MLDLDNTVLCKKEHQTNSLSQYVEAAKLKVSDMHGTPDSNSTILNKIRINWRDFVTFVKTRFSGLKEVTSYKALTKGISCDSLDSYLLWSNSFPQICSCI